MMVMEERGNWSSNRANKSILSQLHSFAEEDERMRLFQKGQIVENGFIAKTTNSLFQTKPGFSSVTDGERTSNSGSDTGTPAAGDSGRIPFQALVDLSADERPWRMLSVESCNGDDDDMENGTSLDDMKDSHEDMEMVTFLGRDGESVQSKLCPRGHWRPAEDDKLRQLVSQYGPQNWNLIAEKLQGRSGTALVHRIWVVCLPSRSKTDCQHLIYIFRQHFV